MEPVGIYSSVGISRSQLGRFYADRGDALIDDVRCILGRKPGFEYKYGGFFDAETGCFHDERNKLVMRYD